MYSVQYMSPYITYLPDSGRYVFGTIYVPIHHVPTSIRGGGQKDRSSGYENAGFRLSALSARAFAMRHWSFLLHRRKIGFGRIESNTVYCRGMPCEKLDQN